MRTTHGCDTCNKHNTSKCDNYIRIAKLLQTDGFEEAQEIAEMISYRLGLQCHSHFESKMLEVVVLGGLIYNPTKERSKLFTTMSDLINWVDRNGNKIVMLKVFGKQACDTNDMETRKAFSTD